jgi:flagellar hook protein FlgE
MMRSLYSGVSGLQNHQIRMDVVGNNISNVNTTGFKRGRVNFQDLISQMQRGPAQPNERVGGVNPQQVGLGMQVATIDTIHTQGSLQTTGVKSDVAIQGEGFFTLRSGDETFFSRAGAFGVDSEGFLVNPSNGMRVQGWNATSIDGETFINSSATVEDLVIPVGSKDPAQQTSEVFLASNLNKNTPVIPANATDGQIQEGTWTVEYDIYDSFGGTHTLRIDFARNTEAENQWIGTVAINPEDEDAIPQTININGVESADGETFILEFANDGTILSAQNPEGGLSAQDMIQVDVSYEVPATSIPIDPDTGLPQEGPVEQTFTLNLGQQGSFVDAMTQYASESSTKVFSQNGFPMGYLEDYRIDASGIITGIFSNGNNRELGQIALSTFRNPGGLEKAGDTTFQQSLNSGLANIGTVGVAGKGTIMAGALEMSNVDLAEQFTDMIVTQRGFQANSRTIQTADQILQEVLTLKR